MAIHAGLAGFCGARSGCRDLEVSAGSAKNGLLRWSGTEINFIAALDLVSPATLDNTLLHANEKDHQSSAALTETQFSVLLQTAAKLHSLSGTALSHKSLLYHLGWL